MAPDLGDWGAHTAVMNLPSNTTQKGKFLDGLSEFYSFPGGRNKNPGDVTDCHEWFWRPPARCSPATSGALSRVGVLKRLGTTPGGTSEHQPLKTEKGQFLLSSLEFRHAQSKENIRKETRGNWAPEYQFHFSGLRKRKALVPPAEPRGKV